MSQNNNSEAKRYQKNKKLRQEATNELGINLNSKNLTAKEVGPIGGIMVKKMIEELNKHTENNT